MPVIRKHLSVSQFCELVGIEEAEFHSVEWGFWGARTDGQSRCTREIIIVLEPTDGDDTRRDAADVREHAVSRHGRAEGPGTPRAEDDDAGAHAEGRGSESAAGAECADAQGQ